jgi:hypothetical protein
MADHPERRPCGLDRKTFRRISARTVNGIPDTARCRCARPCRGSRRDRRGADDRAGGTPGQHTGTGDVQESAHGQDLKRDFGGEGPEYLKDFGEGRGHLPGDFAAVSVTDHDTERTGTASSGGMLRVGDTWHG